MRTATLRWCNWSGVVFILGWLIGFVVFAGFVPPPSPSAAADEIAGVYEDNRFGIRFGLMLTLFVSPLYAAWAAALSAQMKRIRNTHPVMGDLQLVLGGLTVLVFMIPALLMEIAAFRPDRDPGTIQTLNDIAWMMFIAMGATAILQPLVVGVAILLQSPHDEPIFPRWAGYFSVWTAVVFLPGPACVYFKSGLMAWDGFLPWWIPFAAFLLWVVVMIVLVRQSIQRSDLTPSLSRIDPDLRAQVEDLISARLKDVSASRST